MVVHPLHEVAELLAVEIVHRQAQQLYEEVAQQRYVDAL